MPQQFLKRERQQAQMTNKCGEKEAENCDGKEWC